MRICFVSREVAGVRGGGIGTYVAEAGKALTARGHEVWLLTEDPGKVEIPGFARVVPVKPRVDRATFLFAAPHYEHAFAVHETLLGCGVSFDYIEFADYQAEGLVAIREQRLFRTYGDAVLAVTLHSPAYECYRFNSQLHRCDQVEREVFLLEDDMLRDVEFLNSPSVGLRDLVTERLGRDPDDVAIVRYPMQLDEELPQPTPNAAALADLEFLFFGRIEPRKGVENLIAAFARMPELRLKLMGGDMPFSPYGGSFREWLARKAPSNVEFVDPLPREEALRAVASADVCILPSLFENWPNACLEAMAAGRVVVGSVHGGMGEMIGDGMSGFHVDGRSVDDIERVVREGVGKNLHRLSEIGANAAAWARHVAEPDTYSDTIEALVAKRRGATSIPPATPKRAPLVSVVIPFYKDRATVDAAVESAVAQAHPELEILIVNDGSPLEDADAILARQTARDPRVRVLTKDNGGLSSARNHGIRAARGDYLLFLDADNVARPEYAATAASALEARPDLGFAVPHVRFFDDATGADVGIYNPLPYVRGFALMINRFGDAGAFIRREVLVEHELEYDEMLISFEDWALWMDLDRVGVRGLSIPRVLYDYRMRSDSMMQEDAWPNFRALIGLLIERHYPADAELRDVLWTLNQTWGRDASLWQQAREEKGRWPARYWFVDKLYGAMKKFGLGTAVDRVGQAMRKRRD